MDLYNISEVYNDFRYPKEFLKVIELDLVDYDLWYLMNAEQVKTRVSGLQERYSNRKLIPFARRDDSDDIACFEVGKENKVQIIHDFASDGFEQRKEYDSFWSWFKDAIQEMIEEEETDE